MTAPEDHFPPEDCAREWEEFAWGGIHGLSGLREGDYAFVARPEGWKTEWRAWGECAGHLFASEHPNEASARAWLVSWVKAHLDPLPYGPAERRT